MYTLISLVVFIVVSIAIFFSIKKNTANKKFIEKIIDTSTEPENKIEHTKNEYLCTRNEQKLLYCLQKVLDSKYLIHCQTSLIELVEPVDFRHKSKAWTKRVDFVITDKSSKILAVIELDDSTHKRPARIKRDQYVNDALNEHHPLIRIQTEKFYEPHVIAELLENKAQISNFYAENSINDALNAQKSA